MFALMRTGFLLAALLVWRHKTNILNLVAGKERRIGEKQDSVSA